MCKYTQEKNEQENETCVHLKCQTKYRESIYTTLGAYYSFAPHSFLTTIRVESVNVL